MLPNRLPVLLLLLPLLLPAQERSDFQQILQRLEQLEPASVFDSPNHVEINVH